MRHQSLYFGAFVTLTGSSISHAFVVPPNKRLSKLFQLMPKGATSSEEEGVVNGIRKKAIKNNEVDTDIATATDIATDTDTDADTDSDADTTNTENGSKVMSSNNKSNNINSEDSNKPLARRSMDLMWCGKEYCSDVIRERVSGKDNNMEFEGPATGQVCYVWDDPPGNQKTPSVLLLVKKADDELLQYTAEAINDLLERNDKVQILVSPDVCARLKHYHGVDDNKLKLFEPTPNPAFGGSHVATDDTFMGEFRKYKKHSKPNPDLICTVGGDGLLMYASMLFPGACPPILCVAGGSLGFLTPFKKDELVSAIEISLGISNDEKLREELEEYDPIEIRPSYKNLKDSIPKSTLGLGNKVCLSMRMRLDVRVVNREGVVRARFNVLNEVVIDRGSSPYLAALECFVDDVHLTTVQADGVIFATPTGSTAYSMAAGGSVVHPAVPAILVTPICPHVLSFRSMIFPDSVVLRCYVPDDARADASVAFDGKYRRELHRGDSVQIQMSQHPVPTINRADHSADWLSSLKRNFNFNTRARQRPL